MTSILAGAPVSLARNFTLAELCRTSTGLANEPTTDVHLASLALLATRVLQPIRDHFGEIVVTSGFRAPEVNASVGGSVSSQHMRGEAADIVARYSTTREVFLWLTKQVGLPLGQVIHERPKELGASWVHVSLPGPGKPREHLVWDGERYVKWEGKV